MLIKNVKDLAIAYRQGKYSSYGCYPLFFITYNGECLSYEAVKENYIQIARAIRDQYRSSGWLVVGHDANWEDPDLYCAHTNERIESAYADEEVQDYKSEKDPTHPKYTGEEGV